MDGNLAELLRILQGVGENFLRSVLRQSVLSAWAVASGESIFTFRYLGV